MPIPDSIEILTPWRIIAPSETEDAQRLAAELARELVPGHVLYGIRAKAVAMRIDRDDVLFEVEGVACRLAVVHLTWSKEPAPRWPAARLFESWESWLEDEMRPSHEDYCTL
jgi:hypothetical protein